MVDTRKGLSPTANTLFNTTDIEALPMHISTTIHVTYILEAEMEIKIRAITDSQKILTGFQLQ